jgi:hypothetical protein
MRGPSGFSAMLKYIRSTPVLDKNQREEKVMIILEKCAGSQGIPKAAVNGSCNFKTTNQTAETRRSE